MKIWRSEQTNKRTCDGKEYLYKQYAISWFCRCCLPLLAASVVSRHAHETPNMYIILDDCVLCTQQNFTVFHLSVPHEACDRRLSRSRQCNEWNRSKRKRTKHINVNEWVEGRVTTNTNEKWICPNIDLKIKPTTNYFRANWLLTLALIFLLADDRPEKSLEDNERHTKNWVKCFGIILSKLSGCTAEYGTGAEMQTNIL